MKRRDFFKFGGSSVMIAGMAGITPPAIARNFPSPRKDRTHRAAAYPPAAKVVAAEFEALLLWMRVRGWAPVLKRIAGFDLDAALAADEKALFADLELSACPSLAEFGGKRAIQPGDPAMSLLYHVLAASEATYAVLSPAAYPRAEQIDALENYIFDRANVELEPDLELAVFAFEYRQAYKTAHRAHADILYSRAGIARTGTQDCHYDPMLREYRAPLAAESVTQDCATIPSRFGLFLARRQCSRSIDRIAGNALDEGLSFLVPVCKLVSGGRLLNGRNIQFQQSHRDEKLLRLMREVQDPGTGFKLNQPPFLRTCMSEDGPDGAKALDCQTSSLVALRAMRGSARLFPEARPIIRPAYQGERITRFFVPAKTPGATSNRRYTSLKLLQDRRAEGLDAFFSDYLFRGGRPTTGLRAARNAPSFAYIRAKVEANDTLTFLSRSKEHLDQIASGEYEAALFEDGLCDGCVTAKIAEGVEGKTGAPPAFLSRPVLPAISFVSAPDFFPRVDPLDLERFDDSFLEGGTECASGLRLQPNPLVERPGQPGTSAFSEPSAAGVSLTMTAAVGWPADTRATHKAVGYVRPSALNTLPDTVSAVFFPGWDFTYSNEARLGRNRFLASFGLGSPFPEDMKLCAAANGMWAGASPDAARTYYGTLERLPVRGRPATAVPLMDFELGYHPASPAIAEKGFAPDRAFGWDGEQGPFLEIGQGSSGQLVVRVNCADIMLSDYVRNALEGRMDLGRMQNLHNRDLIDRMAMLKTCIAVLPHGGHVATSDMWLVSAEAVADWTQGAEGLNVPDALAPRDAAGRIEPAPGLAGKGFLYVFAHCPSPGEGLGRSSGRKSFHVKRIHMCHGDGVRIRYASLDPLRAEDAPLAWSRPHALRYP